MCISEHGRRAEYSEPTVFKWEVIIDYHFLLLLQISFEFILNHVNSQMEMDAPSFSNTIIFIVTGF